MMRICMEENHLSEQVVFPQHLQGRNAADGADLAAVLPAGTGGGTCKTAAGGLPGVCLCRIPGGTGEIYRPLVCPKNGKESCNMENEIMKFEEVMEFLSVGKNTLYALLNSGEIQAFRIGKVWKIPRKSVTAYVEGKLAGKD